ncbi:MAG: ABC transporter permease [Proteiniphilum sp.]|nr:ABC transporter permease [Proteiniphilum sp.]MDD4415353.1 ABC transporter permease [Proteiniphilum sp.]
MIQHYLKIAWRNLLKYKTQTVISVLGLTVGVVFFAYGYHWYKFETSYDSFYPNADRIYRVYSIEKNTNHQNPKIPYAAAKKIKDDFPEVEKIAIIYDQFSVSLTYENEPISAQQIELVDENFFYMFPPTVLYGSLGDDLFLEKTILDMVVTEDFATKFFKTPENAIGKMIESAYKRSYVIKAIIKNPPQNSMFQADCYIPDVAVRQIATESEEKTQWTSFYQTQLYVQLHKNTDVKAFEDKLQNYAVDNNYNTNLLFGITPLNTVKYHIEIKGNVFEDNNSFNLTYIRTFLIAGLLLFLSVFFNYLNILINSVVQRTREMNLRKVSGADTFHLFVQLFVEIGLLMLLVVILSLCAAELTIQPFEAVFQTTIIKRQLIMILLVSIALILVFLYAIVFASLYRFLRKTSFRKSVTRIQLQRTLSAGKISLAIQLFIGVFFLFSAFIFFRQVHFLQTADWGIKKENIIQAGIMGGPAKKNILDEINQLATVEDICPTGLFTINNEAGPFSQNNISWDGRPADYRPFFQVVDVGVNFVSFFGLEITRGRDFTLTDFSSDVPKVLINEEAARIMQLSNPIGEKIEIDLDYYTPEGPGRGTLEIIGVFRDFHGIGLKEKIMPMVLKSVSTWRETIFYIRAKPGTETATIQAVRAIMEKNLEQKGANGLLDTPLITMTDLLNKLSKTEQDLLKLFLTVAVLCILIAVFGIYSVSQRETQRRRKEIAIRKTAGAKTKEIMAMFFREYLIITGLSSVVALPLAWLFMEGWLQSFAYRISISWWMFVVVALVVCAIVLLTIFSQVHKASNQNPAEVVKSE